METKGQLRSKGMIGAWLTLFGSLITVGSAMGWLPFGIRFDPDTGDLVVNLYSIGGFAASAAIGVGGPLAWIGRKFATSAIKGLW
jgi:hypothetical protein